jgi:hypothetical protein
MGLGLPKCGFSDQFTVYRRGGKVKKDHRKEEFEDFFKRCIYYHYTRWKFGPGFYWRSLNFNAYAKVLVAELEF